MEKQDILTKKNLKRRLTSVMVLYMDGVSNKKQAKLHKYLNNTLDDVAGYYISLLKKSKRKKIILKPHINEPALHTVPQEVHPVSV